MLSLVLGAILMYWVFSLFWKKKGREFTKQKSTIMLDKIQSVCKLVSVEGDFAEIYHYDNAKEDFMGFLGGKKH